MAEIDKRVNELTGKGTGDVTLGAAHQGINGSTYE
ncbi:hypothetical protein YEEN111655_01500 [Yersinia entomophaga]